MLTCEEIAVLAMARVSELTDDYAKSRALMYRRIGVRQQQLFLTATEANHDYFGVAASATIDGNGRADLRDIADPVPSFEQIQKIEVYATDGNAAAPAIGTEISIVPLGDLNADDPPRATIRDMVLRQVGTDLAHVTEILVHYGRLPDNLTEDDADTETEIPTPHDELLVVDLAQWLLNGARGLDEDDRQKAIAQLASEESGLLTGWATHIEHAIPTTSRFTRPPHAPREEDGK